MATSEVFLLAYTQLFDKVALTFTEGRKECAFPRQFEFLTPDSPSENTDPFQKFCKTPTSYFLFYFKAYFVLLRKFECVPLPGPELEQ